MVLLLGMASEARAQEWFDDYERARALIADDQPARAVPLLEQAIRKRPEPGTNILTYGTNRLDEYFPYLLLADARLRVDDLDQAADALAASEAAGVAPPAAREAVASRLAAARRAARLARENETPASTDPPPRVAPAADPPPPVVPSPIPAPVQRTGVLQVRTDPEGATVVANDLLLGATPLTIELDAGRYDVNLRKDGWEQETVDVTLESGATFALDRSLRALPVTAPVPAPPVSAPPVVDGVPADDVANLIVVTQPPGASVYLDDEPLGSTDPETGRLVKSDVPVGTHRLRVSRADHLDRVVELDVVAGDPTIVEAALERVSAPVAPPSTAQGVPVVPPLAPASGLGWGVTLLLLGVAGVAGALVLLGGTRRGREWGTRIGLTSGLPRRIGWGARRGRRAGASGQHFGNYQLLELLGRGGMAEVYRARRGREVCALKRPLERFLEHDEFRERFLREAEIGRTLHHPNIVRILDRGEVGDVPYFTMELIAGDTLRDRLRAGTVFSPALATSIILQVAEALDYAHHKGIVHRDVTSANVMLDRDGAVRVMDYGIASAARFSGLTVTGAFMGTPDYVAPEVASGMPADARSDLYSLGVVFYELLTGQRPFVGETPAATIHLHREQPPQPPSSRLDDCPAELDAIVLRLLAKVPDERYATAETLLIDLREYQNRRP